MTNFNVAINDSYRPKGSTEITKTVTYVQCSYWVNSTIAKYLTKGTLVELGGRIGVTGYIAKDGTAKGSLTFHVNTIKLHGKSNSTNQARVALSNFFNRIAYRKGRPAAISATARKLAVIIWNMIVKGVPYKPQNDYEFLDQKRKRKVQEMKN